MIIRSPFGSASAVACCPWKAIDFLTRDAAEGVAIIGVLFINAVVGFIVEWRSERALESLRIQVRTTARVLRDGVQFATSCCSRV